MAMRGEEGLAVIKVSIQILEYPEWINDTIAIFGGG
jgi:hypothetical protein